MKSHDDVEQANRRGAELKAQAPRAVSARYDPYNSGKCMPFAWAISSDTSVARGQGVAEADSAIGAANSLGMNPPIIYHDIESYVPSAACSAAVVAFLNGWVGELHAKSYIAGVYGNPVPAYADFSAVSPTAGRGLDRQIRQARHRLGSGDVKRYTMAQ